MAIGLAVTVAEEDDDEEYMARRGRTQGAGVCYGRLSLLSPPMMAPVRVSCVHIRTVRRRDTELT